MISPDEARRIVFENIQTLGSEIVSHDHALGRVLARDILADVALPPFDNSAVDGYAFNGHAMRSHAVRSQDLLLPPVDFRVIGTIAAGASAHEYSIGDKEAVRIMTGAPLPIGADCVVMREDTVESENSVQILDVPPEGANIRRRGSDVQVGEQVLEAGTRVRAAQWGMLASLGCAQVEVFRRPRVGILTTGAELKGVDEPISSGEIRDSNSFTLRALVEECGAVVAFCQTVGDDAHEVEAALSAMFACCDAVVSSGGVSMGDFDPIRDVLPQLAQLHFWKIAVKPGKPVMFATRHKEERKIPVWGLPGNPVSVMVSFEKFVRPALLHMGGQNDTGRVSIQVRVLDAFTSPRDKTEYVRAFVKLQGGVWVAHIHGDQGSGRLSTMTRANALLVVPPDVTRVEAGDTIEAELLHF